MNEDVKAVAKYLRVLAEAFSNVDDDLDGHYVRVSVEQLEKMSEQLEDHARTLDKVAGMDMETAPVLNLNYAITAS